MKNSNKRIWLVGGSSGIGLELMKILLNNEFKIVASSRNATSSEELLKLKELYKEKIYLLDLDVEDTENIEAKIKEAWEVFDGLDIWFYNAGAYEVMDMKSWDYKKFALMNSTNYLGVINIMTHISKYFIEQKKGKWIWNLSLSTYFGLPNGGGYSAPKTALLNLAQSIHPELQQENINLQIINHGFVKTRLTSKNSFEMPQLMEPKFAAEQIFKGITRDNRFEIRFPTKLRLFLQFLSLIPYKFSLAITKRLIK
ncbi:short-chain dehydrogenase [Arcobacter sp. CECT 8983]|uniref:SDR family NAD(P)-dependent oxidoreductase n=1 Tax=Arcobacter sp. CECT 8983 TaxID=2044508 RepID=UPI00100C073D|nr:SDR family NAD(P)-dependent oxidoreductase [Arcobacter sp. CECT 8983]RXJ90870.1 short-chain dehydrogenase [Arcobacter sp. CECT 8983]